MTRTERPELPDLIIFDLEATCWVKGTRPGRMETIEIGAVRMDGVSWDLGDEFARFIRPVARPELSDFCTELTTIRQEDVDGAETFPEVFPAFQAWAESGGPFLLCSWGAYDPGQFRTDCNRHRLPYPDSFLAHVNLKKEFAAWQGIRPTGMRKALEHTGAPLQGTHHRGIDDARNIATITAWLLAQGWRPSLD